MFVTSDGVRVRSVARHTATHGVAVSVDGAGCSWATGCGTAGVRGPGSHREMAGPPAQSVVQDHGGARELLGRDAAVHGAATGDVALQAGTDRVALVVHHTLGQAPAGRGVAGGARVLQVPVVAGGPHGELVSRPLRGDEVLASSRRGDTEEERQTEHLSGGNYGLSQMLSVFQLN